MSKRSVGRILDFLNAEIAASDDPERAADEIMDGVLVGVAAQLGRMAAARGVDPETRAAAHAALVERIAVGWEMGTFLGEKIFREHGGPVWVSFAPEPATAATRLVFEFSERPPEHELIETYRRIFDKVHKALLRAGVEPRI
jgi:hypothetical protein